MRLMRLPEVKHATGLSRTAIYYKMRQGKFPQQIRLSERSVAWDSTSVEAWIEQKIMANRDGKRAA
jgi:prophage regulatory protein